MSDIPDAAVKAAIEARSKHGSDPKPYNHGRCRCGANFATAVEHLEHATRRELEAAFEHLRSDDLCTHDWQPFWDVGYAATDCCRVCGDYRPTPSDPPVQRWETTLDDSCGDLG